VAVKLRLKRLGRTHAPFYRICAMDARAARDSVAIEEVGYYNPLEKSDQKAVAFNQERVLYWLGVGAQPTQTVRDLLRKRGIDPVPGKPRIIDAQIPNATPSAPAKAEEPAAAAQG